MTRKLDEKRVLPHDTALEAGILGGIFLQPDLLATLPDLEVEDFWDHKHKAVFQAMRNLEARSTAIDPVTVEFELQREDKLEACGGMAFLGELVLNCPTADNVRAYAAIVMRLHQHRRMAVAASEVLEHVYTMGWDPDDEYLAFSERTVMEVSRRGTRSAPPTAAKIVRDRIKQIYRIAEERDRGGSAITGVPTGIAKLDDYLGGYPRKVPTLVAGRPKMGKAQPLDAKVLTPIGWTTMGSLSVGDLVIGASGKPTRVAAVHERGELGVYRVEFTAGATECCADHLWTTRTRSERRRGLPGATRRTDEVRATLFCDTIGRANHFIPYVRPVEFAPAGDLPLDPYLLGLYLGDGHSSGNVMFTKPEPDIRAAFLERLPAEDVGVIVDDLHIRVKGRGERDEDGKRVPSSFMSALRELGLAERRSHEKFIPYAYRLGSVDTRLAILRGLFDTDGYVTNDRLVEFGTSSAWLRDDVAFVVGSLGGAVTVAEHMGTYTKDGDRHETRPAWRMRVRFPHGDVVPVSSHKHLTKWKPGPLRCAERSVRAVTFVGRKVCRCITVEAPDGMYVTDDFLVTHNSSIAVAATCAATEAGIGAMVFSLEDGWEAYADSLMARGSGVSTEKLRSATLQRADMHPLSLAIGELVKRENWRFEERVLDAPAICRELRRAKAEIPNFGLGVVDYVQLVKRTPRMNEHEAIADHMRHFAAVAKELDIALLVLSQLNRELEKREDKRPTMPDLRGSGSLEECAKLILFAYRGAYYYGTPRKEVDFDCEHPAGATWCQCRPSEQEFQEQIQLIIAANNQGRTGRVFARWEGQAKRVS